MNSGSSEENYFPKAPLPKEEKEVIKYPDRSKSKSKLSCCKTNDPGNQKPFSRAICAKITEKISISKTK
jgi:hypothetical protein